MATFLFWNINRKPLHESVARLVELHDVAVLMLAESPMSAGTMLVSLNRHDGGWQFPFSERNKIQVYTRFNGQLLEARLEAPRWTIRELLLPGLPSIVVAVVHLHDKRNWNDASQSAACYGLARDIENVEARVGHHRTLVVGDFNMNPFETGIIAGNGLHAESTRRIAGKVGRVVDEETQRYFYNPMWNFFGDETRGPAGTYYYRGTEMVRMPWNMFDQVLIRPELFPYFVTGELEILTEDGQSSFLTAQGTPTTRRGSDHLPILFKLNL